MAIIGIDVGNTNCKLAVREGSAMRLISDRMPDNMVRDGDVASPDTMSTFLRSVRSGNRVRERNCALVLNSSQLYFRHVSLPRMTTQELMLNLPYEFRDFIQDDPEDYIYDYAVDEMVRDEAGQITRMELYASAVPKKLVASYADMLRKAGFRLKAAMPVQMVHMRLLSSYFAAIGPDNALPEDHDIVLVDIGHANVIISLFHGMRFDSARTIDFGCDEFDRIIADMKGIDFYTAGSYKISNFEGVLDEPECLALCDRFALEVSKVVNFYSFSNPEREIGKLFFLGGGASIRQLTDTIAEAIAVPCASIVELLPEAARNQDNSAVCALAVGAILEGESM